MGAPCMVVVAGRGGWGLANVCVRPGLVPMPTIEHCKGSAGKTAPPSHPCPPMCQVPAAAPRASTAITNWPNVAGTLSGAVVWAPFWWWAAQPWAAAPWAAAPWAAAPWAAGTYRLPAGGAGLGCSSCSIREQASVPAYPACCFQTTQPALPAAVQHHRKSSSLVCEELHPACPCTTLSVRHAAATHPLASNHAPPRPLPPTPAACGTTREAALLGYN